MTEVTICDDLRALADHLENHPDLAEKVSSSILPIQIYCLEDEFRDMVSQLGGDRTKTFSDRYADVSRSFGSVVLNLFTGRENVCVARVVGTEEVEVPDPDAPKITITRDIIEWDCNPVLD